MIEEKFTVEGLGDEDGEAIVEKALCSIEGVKSAEADHMMDAVVVCYDPKQTTFEELQEVVDLCGFDLTR